MLSRTCLLVVTFIIANATVSQGAATKAALVFDKPVVALRHKQSSKISLIQPNIAPGIEVDGSFYGITLGAAQSLSPLTFFPASKGTAQIFRLYARYVYEFVGIEFDMLRQKGAYERRVNPREIRFFGDNIFRSGNAHRKNPGLLYEYFGLALNFSIVDTGYPLNAVLDQNFVSQEGFGWGVFLHTYLRRSFVSSNSGVIEEDNGTRGIRSVSILSLAAAPAHAMTYRWSPVFASLLTYWGPSFHFYRVRKQVYALGDRFSIKFVLGLDMSPVRFGWIGLKTIEGFEDDDYDLSTLMSQVSLFVSYSF